MCHHARWGQDDGSKLLVPSAPAPSAPSAPAAQAALAVEEIQDRAKHQMNLEISFFILAIIILINSGNSYKFYEVTRPDNAQSCLCLWFLNMWVQRFFKYYEHVTEKSASIITFRDESHRSGFGQFSSTDPRERQLKKMSE